MDWDRAAESISREGGTRMMDAYAMLEHDAEVFARAARCLETLPGTVFEIGRASCRERV
ncbi:Uncharacterised protein [Bifidobacterium longum subsp. infantis]|uniref:Uncharacterized protein n=1 Tax=Bifidobacterium longum subsp. infantis TaxID=1682 RepID=A0A564VCM8_BIFLI|nr:Uncharacterised protein [Bifidobacterium longum subsp. infantis]